MKYLNGENSHNLFIATHTQNRLYKAWVPQSKHTSEWCGTTLLALQNLLKITQAAVYEEKVAMEEYYS